MAESATEYNADIECEYRDAEYEYDEGREPKQFQIAAALVMIGMVHLFIIYFDVPTPVAWWVGVVTWVGWPLMTATDSHIAFWQWFNENLDRFNHFENDLERLIDELSDQLHQIDENLVYEISSENSGSRELVISADGIQESFPSVIKLSNAAPNIPGWTITAFRPRVDITQFTLEYDEKDLFAKDFYFWLQSEGSQLDLILYVPGLSDDNRNEFVNVCYLLLDMAIGEYDVTTKIRYIDHQPLPSNPQADGLQPLTELPSEFDALHATLHANGS